ncbi:MULTISPECIES: hypothetical protein [unclassified Dehalobacter]|uniref:hypothetical protein n=1 Tax=unclassified Dehalobacter TaxID=2635733 RepID=UPI00039A59C9|nr:MULTISPECIES: hypothetical protein [unclassified Dehalobacter]RJE48827.1 hypothetical protein A7K50_08755 [Dehalobacter sp. MCB1]TCX51989.1 hypothetical protein C1I36_06630 [Dehalobacter sp. 14DCB1]TCX53063.1 hypothetical protein C1I38_08395 [Dehalobacter sp. 12DCB1]
MNNVSNLNNYPYFAYLRDYSFTEKNFKENLTVCYASLDKGGFIVFKEQSMQRPVMYATCESVLDHLKSMVFV